MPLLSQHRPHAKGVYTHPVHSLPLAGNEWTRPHGGSARVIALDRGAASVPADRFPLCVSDRQAKRVGAESCGEGGLGKTPAERFRARARLVRRSPQGGRSPSGL